MNKVTDDGNSMREKGDNYVLDDGVGIGRKKRIEANREGRGANRERTEAVILLHVDYCSTLHCCCYCHCQCE